MNTQADKTPLTILEAVRSGDVEATKNHLSQREDLNERDDLGASALHLAAQGGWVNIIRLFLETEQAAARACASTAGVEPGIPSDMNMVSTLGFTGTLLEALDTYNCTPLHYAANYAQVDAARALLAAGADIMAKSSTGCIPLHFAVSKCAVETTSLLLASGASVNATDDDKWTPLHYAVCKAKTDVLDLLLREGADVNASDQKRRSPLDIAVWKGQVDNTRCLLDSGAVGGDSGVITFSTINTDTVEAMREVLRAGLQVKHSVSFPTVYFMSTQAVERQDAYIVSLLAAAVDPMSFGGVPTRTSTFLPTTIGSTHPSWWG